MPVLTEELDTAVLSLNSFGSDQLYHSPHSLLHLEPSDFYISLHLKSILGYRKVNDYDDLKEYITAWLTRQGTTFSEEGIQKVVLRNNRKKFR